MSNWLPCDQLANAIAALSPADKAAVCNALNCTPAALSQAPLTGVVVPTTVPAAGQSPFFINTSVTPNTLNIWNGTSYVPATGFEALATAAVATATDSIQGKVALNLGTAAGDAANATSALTAAGLAAMLNGTAPNPTPNALQAAVGSNPSQYATAAQIAAVGAGAPTDAPTAANPATVHTNTNGEVFRWNGTVWGLSENGYMVTSPQYSVPLVAGNVILHTFTAPRAGVITVSSGTIYVKGSNGYENTQHRLALNGVTYHTQNVPNTGDINHASIAAVIPVVAGDIVQYEFLNSSGVVPVAFIAQRFTAIYIK